MKAGMLPLPSRKRPYSAVDPGGVPVAPDLSHLFHNGPIAPWISGEEWMDVYRKLAPVLANPEDQTLLRGLDVVYIGHIIHSCWGVAWGARNETANLTILILKALKAIHSSDPTTAAMAAQMAVIRFVKAISEPLRDAPRRGSIIEICREIGVPPWIVQIRHDGSHGDMHDIDVVRKALVFAIGWLKVKFWDVEAKRINQPSYMMNAGLEGAPGSEETAEQSIRLELRKLAKAIKTFHVSGAKRVGKPGWLYQTNLDSWIDSHLALFTTLLTTDFMVPYVVMVDAENDQDPRRTSERQPKLPRNAEKEWSDVVDHVLIHPGGTDALLRSFALLLGGGDQDRDYLIAAWIHSILNRVPKNLVSSVRTWDAVNWTALCEIVTSKPSQYSMGILQLITSWVSNSKEHKFVQDSIRLAKIMTATPPVGALTARTENISKTADGLLEVSELRDSISVNDSAATRNSWTLAADINWGSCPIGLLPHQNVPGFDLYRSLLLPNVAVMVNPVTD